MTLDLAVVDLVHVGADQEMLEPSEADRKMRMLEGIERPDGEYLACNGPEGNGLYQAETEQEHESAGNCAGDHAGDQAAIYQRQGMAALGGQRIEEIGRMVDFVQFPQGGHLVLEVMHQIVGKLCGDQHQDRA
uniref:hypothetical protein n=1 Tax=Neorhizobium sp. EC2-8 TaxID=3129230 RepID=UPI0031013AC3